MPHRPPLYGIFWGHLFCKYGGWGWSELFSIVTIQGLDPSWLDFAFLGRPDFQFRGAQVQEQIHQPKEEVLGTDIPQTSGGHSRGYPGPKLRSGPQNTGTKKASIWARASMTRRRGRP